MKKAAFLFLVLLLLGAPAVAQSYTEDITKIGAGARPMGMGKAFAAVSDDINSLFLNPAGLGQADRFQFTSMYTSLFDGELNYVLFGASNPFDFGSLGFGFISTGTGQIPSPGPTSITYFDYYDRLFLLSYSLRGPVRFGGGLLRAGVNVKYFAKGFTDTVNKHGAGVNADLGIKLDYEDGLSFAANAQNLLGSGISWDTGAVDSLPSILKIGAAKRLFDSRLLLAADCDVPASGSLPAPMHAGVEYRYSKYLTFRAGLDQSISASSSLVNNLAAGIGLTLDSFRFDYSYRLYQESSMNAAHFVSFSVL